MKANSSALFNMHEVKEKGSGLIMQGETNSAAAETEFPQSPDNVMPVAAQQPSCSRPKHALCN